MIAISNLAMNYGPKLLFTDVNFNLNQHRYGLVGANGAGKSTFLKLLTKEEEPSFGEVAIPKNARIGWLKQDQFRFENVAIIDSVIAGRGELWDALKEKEKILEKLENEVCDEATGYRLGELEEIIADNDGYNSEVFAAELLSGLGIKEIYHYQPMSVLSGGYKLRVLLAQSLFNNPDILLLDEPTNHLDMMSIYWLENYLKTKFKGILIFISHDIDFLNNVATRIFDIDYGEIREYVGNYSNFVKEKQEIMELKFHEKQYMEKKINHMKLFIEKFRASATRSKQSQSREKLMDKMEMPDIQNSSRVSPFFNFKMKRPSGKLVLKVNDIAKTYGDKRILNKVNFSVNKNDKVIIIGPNGIGKSTLLKILLSKIIQDSGDFEWGYEAQISYFAQDHHELLNEDMPAFDWLVRQFDNILTSELRGVLGQVLFKKDDAFKSLLKLSGGEGARLLLAKIILEEANILILDEPTNHLDIEAKESLKKALINYPGTLIMVTHDRDFATSIATRIIALGERGIVDFKGKYHEYLERHGNDYLNRDGAK